MPTQHLHKYWQTLSKYIKQLGIDETLKLKICSDPTLDEADIQYEVCTKKELKAKGGNAEKMNRQFGQHSLNEMACNQCMSFPAKETKEMPSKIEKSLPFTARDLHAMRSNIKYVEEVAVSINNLAKMMQSYEPDMFPQGSSVSLNSITQK